MKPVKIYYDGGSSISSAKFDMNCTSEDM
jgi:hypothetical protein